MIASTAVARWTWGREAGTEDWVRECVRHLFGSHAILSSLKLAVGPPVVMASISEAGKGRGYLLRHAIRMNGIAVANYVDHVTGEIKQNMRAGVPGIMRISCECAGIWDDGDVGRVEEKLFMIGSLMTADYLSVELISFSDAWMPYNLRGGEQHDVYVLNSPRLTAALRGITEIVGEEVEPDDATWFGIPTESGFVNHFYADGQAADTWRIFEIPYRNRVFRHVQGSGEASFARTATGEIRCVSVIRGDETLGYLWASDVGGAASFEPNDEPGDAGYSAGLHWLTLLDEARRRDTRPSDALKALSRLPSDPVGGKIAWETMRTLPSFGELADLAGQPRSL